MKTKKGFTKEYLLSKLVEAAELLGHSPSQGDIENWPGFPSRGAYRNHFGTFVKAMGKAGLPLIPHGIASPNHPLNRLHPAFNSRARKTPSPAYLKTRFAIFERDNFTCQYCGRTPQDGTKLQVDHIVPRSKGGSDKFDNLTTSCFECNIGKSDVLIDLHSLKNKKPSSNKI